MNDRTIKLPDTFVIPGPLIWGYVSFLSTMKAQCYMISPPRSANRSVTTMVQAEVESKQERKRQRAQELTARKTFWEGKVTLAQELD